MQDMQVVKYLYIFCVFLVAQFKSNVQEQLCNLCKSPFFHFFHHFLWCNLRAYDILPTMPNKYSVASKKRWESISSEKRSEIMRKLSLKRWKNISIKEKKEIGKKLNSARWSKK